MTIATLPSLLFHGSVEAFERPRVSGYDAVFWTADNSATAQAYIPSAGSSVRTPAMGSYQLNEKVSPRHNDPMTSVAEAMGYIPENVTWDACGHATSWRYPKKGWPTNAEVCDHIEQVLGYERLDGQRGSYKMKMGSWSSETNQSNILPSDHKLNGNLYIFSGLESMRLYDMSKGEPDLLDLQYHKVTTFQKLQEQGWDGVQIDDFCQSSAWGNVGHRSYGFFAPACERLSFERIPARNFDWDSTPGGLNLINTPEFSRWRSAVAARDSIESLVATPHRTLKL